jgi:hypothetical protein
MSLGTPSLVTFHLLTSLVSIHLLMSRRQPLACDHQGKLHFTFAKEAKLHFTFAKEGKLHFTFAKGAKLNSNEKVN